MKSATKRDLAIFELNEEISLFNPTTLKVTETTVRNTLPSAEGKSLFFLFFCIKIAENRGNLLFSKLNSLHRDHPTA